VRIDPDTGRLRDALRLRHVDSPNQDERPEGMEPELIVVHGITLPPGEHGGPWIDHLFTNTLDPAAHPYFAEIAHLTVSAHALIRRDGEIVQYVPFPRRAWHAGVSCWQGRERVNDFSIGIELEGTDDTAYEPIQYRRLAALIQTLCATYPTLGPDRIAGHADVAPGRKTDPGESFDWDELRRLLVG